MARQPRALRASLQAVGTLRRVLERQQSLEHALEVHKHQLPGYEHGTLRDLCSGTLRHWHRYAAVIDAVAPAAVTDHLDARLLMATTLFDAQNTRGSKRSRGKLLDRAEACGQALALPPDLRDACARALALQPHELAELHTAASALSMPEWLHARLASETPLDAYAALLLRRPDFLSLCVDPSVWSPQECVLHPKLALANL